MHLPVVTVYRVLRTAKGVLQSSYRPMRAPRVMGQGHTAESLVYWMRSDVRRGDTDCASNGRAALQGQSHRSVAVSRSLWSRLCRRSVVVVSSTAIASYPFFQLHSSQSTRLPCLTLPCPALPACLPFGRRFRPAFVGGSWCGVSTKQFESGAANDRSPVSSSNLTIG